MAKVREGIKICLLIYYMLIFCILRNLCFWTDVHTHKSRIYSNAFSDIYTDIHLICYLFNRACKLTCRVLPTDINNNLLTYKKNSSIWLTFEQNIQFQVDQVIKTFTSCTTVLSLYVMVNSKFYNGVNIILLWYRKTRSTWLSESQEKQRLE